MDIVLPCRREQLIMSSEDVNRWKLGPVMWITDEMLNRATHVAPITGRHPGIMNIEVEGIMNMPDRLDLECPLVSFKITLLQTGMNGKQRRVVYLLEDDTYDAATCTRRMRWPD